MLAPKKLTKVAAIGTFDVKPIMCGVCGEPFGVGSATVAGFICLSIGCHKCGTGTAYKPDPRMTERDIDNG